MIAETISIERKLQMYEARERILNRINPEINKAIDLDKFLQATVNELGKMMGVDRCDLMVMRKEGRLNIDFEYRAHDNIPSSLGLVIPVKFEQLSQVIKLTATIAIDDTHDPGKNPIFRQLAMTLQTRSLLVVPIILSGELLGLFGFHKCDFVHHWVPDEIQFIESIAGHIAVGYQYTRIYTEKEKEAEINKVLLEIANDINIQRDLRGILAHTVQRSKALLKADFGCLGIMEMDKFIHFGISSDANEGRHPILSNNESLAFNEHAFLRRIFAEKSSLVILNANEDDQSKFYLQRLFTGQAALVVPVVIKDKVLGILCLIWYEARRPFSIFEVRLSEGIASQIAIAMEREQLSTEILRLQHELKSRYVDDMMVGRSEKIQQVIEMVLNVADTNTTVLLEGESGTGKEVIASLIQRRSSRHNAAFVKVNCGAIPESLLESELFGHERGAFTDARTRRIGRFEEANMGTLFLDEVGEMSPAAQVKLLRVLQDGTFARVGGNETLKVDVRIIAATNVDLAEAIEQGRFRADVYYRLHVYPIRLPALRERKEDIALLAFHFLDIFNKRNNKLITNISDSALQALKHFPWPGNVRELEHAIERAVLVAKGRIITIEDLPEKVIAVTRINDRMTLEIELGSTMEEVERKLIEQTLAFTKGDKTRTATILGIGRKTLYRKLEQYNQDIPEKD